MESMLRSCGLLALLVLLATCGGGDSTPIAVSISPASVSLSPGEQAVFSASVTGTGDSSVTWSVQEGAAGGTVDSTGTYVAPVNTGAFHVVAASHADPSKTATALVAVSGTFSVAPSSDVLGISGARDYAATVPVTWSVKEGAAGGTITDTGHYTAPATMGLYHVVATSVQNTMMSVTVNVTVVASGFAATGSMSIGRTAHTATVLQNGKVLIAGGNSCFLDFYYSRSCPLDTAELYDPVAGSFAATGTMMAKRYFHTATLLNNGKVLVTGGAGASAELYDPATGKFTATGSMTTGRTQHTATLLNDGKVLVAGGSGASIELATAELYDPATGKFSATGSMGQARAAHGATRLADGRVLVEGGYDAAGAASTSAELYDPASGTFSAANGMAGKRAEFGATLLANSDVLVTGGADGTQWLATAEVYSQTSGKFTATGVMKTLRADHCAVLLASGAVLVAGPDNTAELYDSAAGTFSQTGNMQTARVYAAAVLLQDGRVLVTGGSDTSSAELYK